MILPGAKMSKLTIWDHTLGLDCASDVFNGHTFEQLIALDGIIPGAGSELI